MFVIYWYYHFPNSVTFRFSEQAKISHDDFYTDVDWIFKLTEILNPTNPMSVRCVFLKDITKHLDSQKTPKTQLYLNFNTSVWYQKYSTWIMLTCIFPFSNRNVFALLDYYKTVLDEHTEFDWSADMLISFKIQSLSVKERCWIIICATLKGFIFINHSLKK